jgi:alkanesulfonate monooxygenase SsuD/methylene tetrahydromethanopterin reductase-like flavin-dependent oxidoreductase (luciferase family)
VLYQAGASTRGTAFAARHAEVVFLTLPNAAVGRAYVESLRRQAEGFGRSGDDIKALQAAFVLVGRTRAEVKAKTRLIAELTSADGELAKWCGWMGFDLGSVPGDTPIAEIPSSANHSIREFLARFEPSRSWTVAEVRDLALLSRRPHRRMGWLIGTADDVVMQMEEWMAGTGIDGFNLIPCPPSSGIDDICLTLVPALQRRGLFRQAYDPAERTLRERYFGAGRAYYRAPATAEPVRVE